MIVYIWIYRVCAIANCSVHFKLYLSLIQNYSYSKRFFCDFRSWNQKILNLSESGIERWWIKLDLPVVNHLLIITLQRSERRGRSSRAEVSSVSDQTNREILLIRSAGNTLLLERTFKKSAAELSSTSSVEVNCMRAIWRPLCQREILSGLLPCNCI